MINLFEPSQVRFTALRLSRKLVLRWRGLSNVQAIDSAVGLSNCSRGTEDLLVFCQSTAVAFALPIHLPDGVRVGLG